VAAAVGGVNPDGWSADARLTVRGSSMLAFSIFINLKVNNKAHIFATARFF
jgi:hypothetical protein